MRALIDALASLDIVHFLRAQATLWEEDLETDKDAGEMLRAAVMLSVKRCREAAGEIERLRALHNV